MSYIKLDTLEYPIHPGDLRLKHPEIGEDFVLPEGYAEVEMVEAPSIEKYQRLQMLPPAFIDGRWIQQVAVVDMNEDEKKVVDELLNPTNLPTTVSFDQPGSVPNVIG